MTPDPLEALRPVRLPPVPEASLVETLILGAAAGILAALLLAGALALVARWRAHHEPRHAAMRALKAAAELPPAERAFAHAVLLRRYVASSLGDEVRAERDTQWLARLDGFFATDFFSHGDGRLYGDTLYEDLPATDIAGIEQTLAALLKRRVRA